MAAQLLLHLPFHPAGFPRRSSPFESPENARPNRFICSAKKKKWMDFFDFGEDPKIRYGDLFSDGGLQDPDELQYPVDPDNEYGFLNFPAKHNPELASLPLLVRGDVRRCCCFVAGGVYENLLFFPVIQLLKERYPGAAIDIIATERGKQTYEMNKNVKRAWVYDLDAHWVVPADYLEFVGNIKNEYYDMLVSTRLAGVGHALTMFMTSARAKIGYVYPNVNAAGSGLFLQETVKAPRLNLAEGGYNMYAELIEVLKNPKRNVPLMEVRPLQIGISKRLKTFVEKKYMQAGVCKGEFLVFHGIESDSKASMQSKGDPDSLLPLKMWAELARATRSKVVFVIPSELDRLRVRQAIGEDTKMVFITTPGQLAAIIDASVGVVTTNTAAVQLACALKKPSVALFSSAKKASLFVPDARQKRCTVVSSDTGILADIDVKAAIMAMKSVEAELLVAA